MELTTRCPECETLFPVSLEQLQLRKGYIRCTQCAHIFDGFEAAVPGSRAGAATPQAAAAEPSVPSPQLQGEAPALAPADRPAHAGFVIPSPEHFHIENPEPARSFTIGPAAPAGASSSEPAFTAGLTGAEPSREAERSLAAEPSIPAGEEPLSHKDEPRIPSVLRQRGDVRHGPASGGPSFTITDPVPSSRTPPVERTEPLSAARPEHHDEADAYLFVEPREGRRSERYRPEFPGEARERAWLNPMWALLTLCGLVLLVLQGSYIYRSQLANNFPGLRPSLEAACERLGCTVPYERRLEAIAITGSALRSSGPPEGDVSRLQLEVTVRNAYERPQEWPTLVLDLKDASGTVVVRRNLGPEIWVPATLREGPFAAGSEVKVQLPVAVRGLQANGYQLDKFFP